MEKLFAGKISASHRQFYFHDSEFDDVEELFGDEDKLVKGLSKHGFYGTRSFVAFASHTENWGHWLEVFLSDVPPTPDDCELLIAVPISVASGELSVHGPSEWQGQLFNVEPGTYCVYFFGYNFGVDINSLGDELADQVIEHSEQFENYPQLERYKIVLVPGKCPKKGVLYSSKKK
ncbi:MAG TPA: hypothetical protein VHU84_00570 [Lacipirellulaceae bacterium]|nr:hypothetical protein [Lacipirellulaceae bacterium]